MPGSSPALPVHRIPEESLVALAEGKGDEGVVALLVSAERSRRLLLLRALDDMTPSGVPGACDDALSLAAAWQLLIRAQQAAPDAFDTVLMYPQTGMWLSSALRRLRGTEQEPTPLWVVLGHLSSVAAAAAVRAGLDFTIAVPVRHGYALLPTLGAAEVKGAGPWTTVWVHAVAGEAWIETPSGRVQVVPDPDRERPGWQPLRWITAGGEDRRLSLALDDLDPYRTYRRPSPPERLADDAATRWQDLLGRAWALLVRDEPQTASAMCLGLMSVSPLTAGEPFRPRSASTGDAFGGVLASEPDDAVQLAVTMVHEFQHTKLSGLLHLASLYRTDASQDDERLYAPWRDDPRPLGGLLQGIYAFTGVTRFWRAHRRAAVGRASDVGHFEFALWRAQLWSVLESVRGHGRLTPLGRRFLDILWHRCAAWLDDPVPDLPGRLADMCATNHQARWRAHHLLPAEEWTDRTAHLWNSGAGGPEGPSDTGTRLAPDRSATHLDSLATLVRHRLHGTDASGGPLSTDPAAAAGHVRGALAGDALLAAGEANAARHGYLARLSDVPDDAAAWAGLGGALTAEGVEPAAARSLTRHPERARAVQRALVAGTGRPADPVRLAAWLGRTVPTV